MLDELRAVSPAAERIGTLVNTHANGDHCYGNQLVAGADIVASAASAREMDEVPPVDAGVAARRPRPAWARPAPTSSRSSARSPSTASRSTPPTTTFDGELDLKVGDRTVHLLELGPAHTRGDVIAHLPDAGILFTGDLVFHGGHPIVWAGPVQRWIDACDRMLALEPDVVVPGHGPLGDRALHRGPARLLRVARRRGHARACRAGMAPLDAARDLAGGPYAGWGEGERLVVNLTALARDLGLAPADDVLTLFGGMAELAASLTRPQPATDPARTARRAAR